MAITLTPLGDRAYLSYFPTEQDAQDFCRHLRENAPAWLEDVVPAYASVGLFFNRVAVSPREAKKWLEEFARKEPPRKAKLKAGKLHTIPCCYDLQLDLARVTSLTKLTGEEVIRLHTSTEFTVYAVGFCPGFPYLGYLPKALSGVPRIDQPRVRIEPGSVGLTGKQTGVYPLARPGGWNILGRTPLELVHVSDHYFPIAVGDRVRFAAISQDEFHARLGERL
jgi:inhibitor of KinA